MSVKYSLQTSFPQNIGNKWVRFLFLVIFANSRGLNVKLQGDFPLQFSCCSKYIESGGGNAPRESPCLARGFAGLGLDRDFVLTAYGGNMKVSESGTCVGHDAVVAINQAASLLTERDAKREKGR